MREVVMQFVLPSFGILLGVGLAVLAYRRHDELGNRAALMMLTSIGIIMANTVLLAGIFSSTVGAAFFLAGAAIAAVSGYLTVARERTQQR